MNTLMLIGRYVYRNILTNMDSDVEKNFKGVGTVTSLHVYPVKSCKVIDLEEAKCIDTGIEFDRLVKHSHRPTPAVPSRALLI